MIPQIGLTEDIQCWTFKKGKLTLNLQWAFKVLKLHTVKAYQCTFLRNCLDNSRLLFSTCWSPMAAGIALNLLGRWVMLLFHHTNTDRFLLLPF